MSSLALILHSAFQKHVFRKLLLLFYSHYCADKNENEKVALFDTQTLDINSLNDEMQQKYSYSRVIKLPLNSIYCAEISSLISIEWLISNSDFSIDIVVYLYLQYKP